MLVFSACWLNIHSVALQTGFTTSTEAKYNYKARREALRCTWFPDSQEGLDRSSLCHLYTHFTRSAKSCLPCLPHKLHRFILESDSRLETETNMVMRFVIGQTSDPAQEAELVAESSQYGGFMRLHLQVHLLACVSSAAASICSCMWLCLRIAEASIAAADVKHHCRCR